MIELCCSQPTNQIETRQDDDGAGQQAEDRHGGVLFGPGAARVLSALSLVSHLLEHLLLVRRHPVEHLLADGLGPLGLVPEAMAPGAEPGPRRHCLFPANQRPVGFLQVVVARTCRRTTRRIRTVVLGRPGDALVTLEWHRVSRLRSVLLLSGHSEERLAVLLPAGVCERWWVSASLWCPCWRHGFG